MTQSGSAKLLRHAIIRDQGGPCRFEAPLGEPSRHGAAAPQSQAGERGKLATRDAHAVLRIDPWRILLVPSCYNVISLRFPFKIV